MTSMRFKILCILKQSIQKKGLDMKVRSEFGIDEPIHLWEAYYIGYADELVLKAQALKLGYNAGCEEPLNGGLWN